MIKETETTGKRMGNSKISLQIQAEWKERFGENENGRREKSGICRRIGQKGFEKYNHRQGYSAERNRNMHAPVKIKAARIQRLVLTGAYLYLALPVMIFFLGWCRWYIGIPGALVLVLAVWCCRKEWCSGSAAYAADRQHMQRPAGKDGKDTAVQEQAGLQYVITSAHWAKLAVIAAVILCWAGLSGVGGYVWQNADHSVRNELFVLLVEGKWPLVKELATESGTEVRGLVYYIGYWLPAALAGKLFGLKAGWAVQYLWAAAGIALLYAWICLWRKKLAVWPLWILIFFSGLDAAGVLLSCQEELRIFGDVHLEAWAPYYQFSSMTTQLFWVFNQAVPAWLMSALVFLGEKPRNMAFLASLTILTATFPFVGVLPFVLYFMIVRSRWDKNCRNVCGLLKSCRKNWGSLQNVAGSAVTVVICGIYIAGNHTVRNSLPAFSPGRKIFLLAAGIVLVAAALGAAVLALRGRGRLVVRIAAALVAAAAVLRFFRLPYADWQSPLYYWMNHTLFYMLEAGVYLLVLYPSVKDKQLFALNAVWLYLIPLILVGGSCDFCMRASIPGLFLVMLWCIRAVDTGLREKGPYRACLLLVLLAVGAVTPVHEMKRSLVHTREYYQNQIVEEDAVFMGNNFSGSIEGFFWRRLAKAYQIR